MGMIDGRGRLIDDQDDDPAQSKRVIISGGYSPDSLHCLPGVLEKYFQEVKRRKAGAEQRECLRCRKMIDIVRDDSGRTIYHFCAACDRLRRERPGQRVMPGDRAKTMYSEED